MKVNTNIDLVDNRYRVSIKVYDPTSLEADLLERFEEPLVEVGGSIIGSATREGEAATEVNFTLPTEQRRLVSDMPLIKYFDLDDSADADVQAKVYSTKMLDRIIAARDTLLANVTNFEGETTVTI